VKCWSGDGGDFIETRTGTRGPLAALNLIRHAKPHGVIYRQDQIRDPTGSRALQPWNDKNEGKKRKANVRSQLVEV
jgi:hypothetical protein